jgi:hypothetical protein
MKCADEEIGIRWTCDPVFILLMSAKYGFQYGSSYVAVRNARYANESIESIKKQIGAGKPRRSFNLSRNGNSKGEKEFCSNLDLND